MNPNRCADRRRRARQAAPSNPIGIGGGAAEEELTPPPASDPYRRGMAMVERCLVDVIDNLLLPNT